MAKQAVCISCYNFYDHRVELVMDQLRAKGYECHYITGDFNHFTRQRFTLRVPDGEQVHTLLYKRNVSPARILSHIKFARDVFRRVEQLRPSLLYVMVPPNSLSREAAAYKKRHPQTKLVLDLYDLWPETFPSDRVKRLAAPAFALWGKMRDMGLGRADLIYTECALFRQALGSRLDHKKTAVLPLCRERVTAPAFPQAPRTESLHLCYLGNVGKLLDMETLSVLLREIVKLRPATLHVIGTGETKQLLLETARAAGAEAVDHDIVYDPEQRQKILDQCHFGINMMKTSVVVGLTMKSLDYFAGGLPVINTIAGDTREIIQAYDAGIEVNRANLTETARRAALLAPEQYTQMRRNAVRLFEENYSVAKVRRILSELE